MNQPCGIKVNCPGTDSPFENLSSEAPDTRVFIGINFGWDWNFPQIGWTWDSPNQPAFHNSTVSQDDANRGAANDQIGNTVSSWNTQNGNSVPLFFNTLQACTMLCPDGLPFTYLVFPGFFRGLSQAQADAIASSYACAQARINLSCLSSLSVNGFVGQPYSQTVTVTGPGTFTFSVLNGTLPTGLVLSNIGSNTALISGTPTTAGSFTFTLIATNAQGIFIQKTYTLSITSNCIGFFTSQTWTHNDTFQSGGTGVSSITGNVIELSGSVPAVLFALSSPEMDVNAGAVVPVPLSNALTCTVTILVNFISGGVQAQSSFGFILEDKVTNQVYFNVSGIGFPVSGVYTVNLPAGAKVNGGFGFTLYAGNQNPPSAGSFDIQVILGT